MSTSSAQYEGAPNIFLQAAVSGTPVLSLDDVGEQVHGVSIGRYFSGGLSALKAGLQAVWQDDQLLREWSACDTTAIEAKHDLDIVSREFLAILERTCRTAGDTVR